jgi:hypothetical protein
MKNFWIDRHKKKEMNKRIEAIKDAVKFVLRRRLITSIWPKMKP